MTSDVSSWVYLGSIKKPMFRGMSLYSPEGVAEIELGSLHEVFGSRELNCNFVSQITIHVSTFPAHIMEYASL